MSFTVRGTILQTPSPERLEVREHAIVTVDDATGRISQIENATPDRAVDIDLGVDTVLIPGLIDTHLHAPQWPQLGTGLDLPLDRWLQDYTFPLEARFDDVDYARRVWDAMVPELLNLGTTTAVYYGSRHVESTVALAEACQTHGQRAFIGRAALDLVDTTPEWYRDADAAASVEQSQQVLDGIVALDPTGQLVRPVVTPRFIPSCSDASLQGHGELAAATGALVQTHCSEGDWQHAHVAERCGMNDAFALDRFGLLRDHTVLAHATHLAPDDRSLIIERGAGAAHCPLSNSYFANAVFPARQNLAEGMRIGLGTDVAGGSTASMLEQCEHAVTVSRMLEDGVDVTRDHDRGRADSRIDVTAAFYLATAGGAELLGIDAGLLVAGRLFDAVAVDLGPSGGLGIDVELDDWERRFEKLVRRGRASSIRRVWVGGVEPNRQGD